VIYEIGETEEGRHYIAMEYVDGVTLRQHMTEARLKLSEVLDVAVQVASGIAAAHEVGVVHRDVKPENIMLRRDGYVKVLDFGLAKLTEQPTTDVTTAAGARAKTDTGMVMGTSSYMSPEQARGLTVDARTDIWSLGVVIYEMVTGEAPFKGETTSDVIVSILDREPLPLAQPSPEAPAELQRMISKTLHKDREERYQTAKDLLIDLKSLKQDLEFKTRLEHSTHSELNSGEIPVAPADTEIATQPNEVQATDPRNVSGRAAPVSDVEVKRAEDSGSPRAVAGLASQARLPGRRLIWMASLSVLVIAGSLFLYLLRHTPESTLPQSALPPIKVVPLTSLPGTKMTPAFSSDGNQVAFAWNRTELPGAEIYVKLVSEGEPRQLTHSGKVNFSPVWSPDGQRIAFVRIISEGETAIFIISAYGEGERKLLSFDWGEERRISWSPDGKFLAFADFDNNHLSRGSAIFLLSLDTLEKRALTAPAANYSEEGPAFSPDGHNLAFVRRSNSDADLYVVPVSGGEPRRLTFGDDLFWTGPTWTEDGREIVFSSERTGSSALWRIPVSGGNPQRLEVGGDDSIQPSISRQGHRLAYMRWAPDWNIYRIVLPDAKNPGNSPAPFLASTRVDAYAQLSPDGKRIAFQSNRSGSSDGIWVCDIDGSNCTQVTSPGASTDHPRWSPDGKRIVCDSVRDGKTSIYTIDLETRGMRGLVADPSEERAPSWSRDGQWVYFASKRSGSWQIWKVLAEGGAPVQVTKQGGFIAFESSDARFVYYDKGGDVAGVWRVPIDGGEEILILDQLKPGMSGNWAVVDDGIYFIRFDFDTNEGALLFSDFATGRVKEIAKLGRHHIMPGGLSVSSDRRSFFYTVWEHQAGSDIMLVENFR
jgi:Tol biopolymer transport system component